MTAILKLKTNPIITRRSRAKEYRRGAARAAHCCPYSYATRSEVNSGKDIEQRTEEKEDFYCAKLQEYAEKLYGVHLTPLLPRKRSRFHRHDSCLLSPPSPLHAARPPRSPPAPRRAHRRQRSLLPPLEDHRLLQRMQPAQPHGCVLLGERGEGRGAEGRRTSLSNLHADRGHARDAAP